MNTLAVIRRWLLAVLVLGIVGTGAELLLFEHYETLWQFVPLLLILVAMGVLLWHGVSKEQFDKEIGKYVGAKETARLWRYVVIQ